MADETEKPTDPTRPANAPLPPKRRQQMIERGRPPIGPASRAASEDRLSQINSRLDSLAERLGFDDDLGADEPVAPVPIRERRFSRSGTINGEDGLNELLKGGTPTSVPAVPLNDGVEAYEAAGPEGRAPGRVAAPRLPGISAAAHRRQLKMIFIAAQIFGLTLLVCGFLAGWLIFSDNSGPGAGGAVTKVAPKPNTDGFGPVTAGDYALQAADSALKAEREGDLEHAHQLFDEMARQEMVLPGLSFRLAVLALRRGDPTEGDIRLLKSIRLGEEVSSSYILRATFAGVKGDYTNATRSFDAAAHAAPFSAAAFFYWGECLRRDGKPLAAITRFDQALARPLLDADVVYIRFKRDLARIESANDKDFTTSITDKLKQPGVTGDTCLLAAAIEIVQGGYAAGADYLKRAMALLPAAEFELKTADYLYQAELERPTIAAVLGKPRKMPTTDPAAWGIQETDPGRWPRPTMVVAH